MLILLGVRTQKKRHEVLTPVQAFPHVILFLCHHLCSYGSNGIASLPDVLVFLYWEVRHHFGNHLWEVLPNKGEENLRFGVVTQRLGPDREMGLVVLDHDQWTELTAPMRPSNARNHELTRAFA